jgi:ribosomal protein S18 acetylase RimI-like enzyme
LEFKIATLQDIELINKLVNSAYRGEFSKKGWTTETDILGGQRTDAQALAAIIEEPKSFILLLFDPELVACVYLKQNYLKNKEKSFYLGMLTVQPDLQAKAYGRSLLSEAEARVKALGVWQIEMEVISRRKELIAWYQRRGYLLTAERRPFPVADPRFGIPKVDDLEFVVLRKNL